MTTLTSNNCNNVIKQTLIELTKIITLSFWIILSHFFSQFTLILAKNSFLLLLEPTKNELMHFSLTIQYFPNLCIYLSASQDYKLLKASSKYPNDLNW
jgi:hypothetical protein